MLSAVMCVERGPVGVEGVGPLAFSLTSCLHHGHRVLLHTTCLITHDEELVVPFNGTQNCVFFAALLFPHDILLRVVHHSPPLKAVN